MRVRGIPKREKTYLKCVVRVKVTLHVHWNVEQINYVLLLLLEEALFLLTQLNQLEVELLDGVPVLLRLKLLVVSHYGVKGIEKGVPIEKVKVVFE